jgi:hypothetical protein
MSDLKTVGKQVNIVRQAPRALQHPTTESPSGPPEAGKPNALHEH